MTSSEPTPVPIAPSIAPVITHVLSSPSTAASNDKRKGRKPKGGKIISKLQLMENMADAVPNVILHLKCSLKDLEEYNESISHQIKDPSFYTPEIPPDIQTYNSSGLFCNYEATDQEKNNRPQLYSSNLAYGNITSQISFTMCRQCGKDTTKENEEDTPSNKMQKINQKLKALKIRHFKNQISNKKSACFWCTCDFDNPECHIIYYDSDKELTGYGSFCLPECAVAYLMEESIDDSIKFDRYHLINQIYGKIFQYKKNIKPAPNPHYLLDKFYGNMTIQEYRELLNSEHILYVLNKPLTKILPELHESTEETVVHNGYVSLSQGGGGASAGGDASVRDDLSKPPQVEYKVKKRSDGKTKKGQIQMLHRHFGM